MGSWLLWGRRSQATTCNCGGARTESLDDQRLAGVGGTSRSEIVEHRAVVARELPG